MRVSTIIRSAILVLSVIAPGSPASGQRVQRVGVHREAEMSRTVSLSGRSLLTRPLGTIGDLSSGVDSVATRPPRWPKYAAVGAVVGFVASALIARSMICPDTNCLDGGDGPGFPLIGVAFYGVLGAGVGALVGAGTGAFLDARAREGAERAAARAGRS